MYFYKDMKLLPKLLKNTAYENWRVNTFYLFD